MYGRFQLAAQGVPKERLPKPIQIQRPGQEPPETKRTNNPAEIARFFARFTNTA